MDILNKKKLLRRNERSFEIKVPLIKPTDTSYTIVNFETLLQRDETQHNSDDNDTYSSDDSSGSCSQKDEVLELVPSELLAKGIGYDVKDQFIDDSELVIPLPKKDMKETCYGGYFLNVGQVRSKHEKRPETPKKLKDKPAGKKTADKKADKNEPQKPVRMAGMPPTQRRMIGQPPNKRIKMNTGLELISSDTDDDSEKLPSPKASDRPTESSKSPEKVLEKKSPQKVKSPKKMASKKLESNSPLKQDQFKKPRKKRTPKVIVDTPSTDNQPSTSDASTIQPTTPVVAKDQAEKASLEKTLASTPTKPSNQLNLSDFMSKIGKLKNEEEVLAFLKQNQEYMKFFMNFKATNSTPQQPSPKLSLQKAPSPRPSTSSDTAQPSSNTTTLINQVNRLSSPSKQTSNVVSPVQAPSTSTTNVNQLKQKRPYNKKKPVDVPALPSNLASQSPNAGPSVQTPSISTNNTEELKKKRPYNKKKSVDTSALPVNLLSQSTQSSNVVPSTSMSNVTTTPNGVEQLKQKRPYNKKKPVDVPSLSANLPALPVNLPNQPTQSSNLVPPVQIPSTSMANATTIQISVEPKQKQPYNKKPVDNSNLVASSNNGQSSPNVPLLISQSTKPSNGVPSVQMPSSVNNVAATPPSSVEPKKKRQYIKKQVPSEASKEAKQATNSPASLSSQKELLMKSLTKTPDGNFLFMGKPVDASTVEKVLAQFNNVSTPQVPKQSVNNISTPQVPKQSVNNATSSLVTPKPPAIEVKTPAASQQQLPVPRTIQPALNNTSISAISMPSTSTNTSTPVISKSNGAPSVTSKSNPAQKTPNGATSDTPKVKKPRKQNETSTSFAMNQLVGSNLMPNFLPNTSQHNNNLQAFNAAMLSNFITADQMKKQTPTITASSQKTPLIQKAEMPSQKPKQISNMTNRPNVQLQQVPINSTPSTFAQTSSTQQQFISPLTSNQPSTTLLQVTPPSNVRSYSSSNPPYKPVHPSQYPMKGSIQNLPRTSNSSLPNWTPPTQNVQQSFYNQSPSFSHNFTPPKPQQFFNVSHQQSPINLQRSQPKTNLTPPKPTTQQSGSTPRMSAINQQMTVGEMINQYRSTFGYDKPLPVSIQDFLASQQRINNNVQSNLTSQK